MKEIDVLKKLVDVGVRFPRRIGVLALALLVITGAIGGPAAEVLKARNDFEDPGSESASARKQLERATRVEPAPGVLAVVKAPPRSAAAADAARKLERDPGVGRVISYAETHDPRL